MTSKTIWPTGVFLAAASIALVACGRQLAGRFGIFGGLMVSFALTALVLGYAQMRLLRLFRSRRLEGRDPWGALALVEKWAQRLQIAAPQVYVFECATPAAFSIGSGRWDSAILLSQALMDGFTPNEIEAVVARETLRLARHDTAMTMLSSSLAVCFLGLGSLLDRLFLPGSLLFSPLIFLFHACTDRPRRCLAFDRTTADLTGDAGALARALWKLQSYCATRPIEVAFTDAHLFVVNPLTHQRWYRYLILQPTVERRIKHLVGQYPL